MLFNNNKNGDSSIITSISILWGNATLFDGEFTFHQISRRKINWFYLSFFDFSVADSLGIEMNIELAEPKKNSCIQ